MVCASASTYASILGKVAKATAQDASQVLSFYAASVAPIFHRKHRALHHDSKFCFLCVWAQHSGRWQRGDYQQLRLRCNACCLSLLIAGPASGPG